MASTQSSPANKQARPIMRKVTRFLAGNVVFAILVFAGIGTASWLIWQRAIVPLQTDAGLPAGIPGEIPRLDGATAQRIGQARSERINHQPRSYARFSTLFIANSRVVRP